MCAQQIFRFVSKSDKKKSVNTIGKYVYIFSSKIRLKICFYQKIIGKLNYKNCYMFLNPKIVFLLQTLFFTSWQKNNTNFWNWNFSFKLLIITSNLMKEWKVYFYNNFEIQKLSKWLSSVCITIKNIRIMYTDSIYFYSTLYIICPFLFSTTHILISVLYFKIIPQSYQYYKKNYFKLEITL